MANFLKPLSEAIAEVQKFQNASRSAKDKNNVFGVGEGIGIFGWVAVEPAPAPYAAEMVGAAKFYTNKILREFKGKDENQVAWTNAWNGFLDGLVPYIKKWHTTGLAWNPRGGDAKVPAAAAAPAAAAPKPAAATAPKGVKIFFYLFIIFVCLFIFIIHFFIYFYYSFLFQLNQKPQLEHHQSKQETSSQS